MQSYWEDSACPKIDAKIAIFCEDKGPKDLVFLKIKGKKTYFHKVRGSKEHISLKIEDKIVIFLWNGQNRNVLKHNGGKTTFNHLRNVSNTHFLWLIKIHIGPTKFILDSYDFVKSI